MENFESEEQIQKKIKIISAMGNMGVQNIVRVSESYVIYKPNASEFSVHPYSLSIIARIELVNIIPFFSLISISLLLLMRIRCTSTHTHTFQFERNHFKFVPFFLFQPVVVVLFFFVRWYVRSLIVGPYFLFWAALFHRFNLNISTRTVHSIRSGRLTEMKQS